MCIRDRLGVGFAINNAFSEGGEGAVDMARLVVDTIENNPSESLRYIAAKAVIHITAIRKTAVILLIIIVSSTYGYVYPCYAYILLQYTHLCKYYIISLYQCPPILSICPKIVSVRI